MLPDNTSIDDLIKEIEENIMQNPTSIVGPSYQDMNKMLADLYLQKEEELKGIYHLTEAHAATLRQQTVIKYDYKEDLIKSFKDKSSNSVTPITQGLDKKYVEFGSDLALQKEEGLLSRLKEMPKEWTVVQITRQFLPQERFKIRPKDAAREPSNLHIVRLPCGTALNEVPPVTCLVEMPEKTEGMPTIFELLRQATKEYLLTKKTRAREIRQDREKGAQYIKEIVEELSTRVLKEWRCLLLGSLCSSQHAKKVRDCIDSVISSEKYTSYKMHKKDRQLLYCVADGAVHLSCKEILSAVCCLVDSRDLGIDLVKAITVFKDEMSILLAARRHPVILIVDEALDSLPWEMLPIIRKHPVSRVPSVHFLHALYHEHKDHIVDGSRLVNKLEMGFYIINPGQDLKDMESRLVGFLEQRIPEWKGIKGTSPTEEEFSSALVQNNIFLYCGHFNGSHYLRPDDIANIKVVALPLLFGCSSVALQDLGGCAQPTGVSDKYIMAGSACVIGMLWTVTSDETDCMTVMLLNSWLPGEPINLTTFRPAGDMLAVHKEPELLRLMRHARDTAVLYSNAAALVARGIPVLMVND